MTDYDYLAISAVDLSVNSRYFLTPACVWLVFYRRENISGNYPYRQQQQQQQQDLTMYYNYNHNYTPISSPSPPPAYNTIVIDADTPPPPPPSSLSSMAPSSAPQQPVVPSATELLILTALDTIVGILRAILDVMQSRWMHALHRVRDGRPVLTMSHIDRL